MMQQFVASQNNAGFEQKIRPYIDQVLQVKPALVCTFFLALSFPGDILFRIFDRMGIFHVVWTKMGTSLKFEKKKKKKGRTWFQMCLSKFASEMHTPYTFC